MKKLVVLLMPWGRVGSNLVNGVVQRSKAMKVWNEPLTAVQTVVVGQGGSRADIAAAQFNWIKENLESATTDIFLNIAANSIEDPNQMGSLLWDLKPTFICLDRKDDLATAISALRTEQWVREGALIGEKRAWSIPSGLSVSFRPHIEASRLRAAINIIREGRRKMAIITGQSQCKTFFYEDLVADMGGTITTILTAAAIPAYDFKISTAKFGSSNLADMLENHEEIRTVAEELGLSTKLETG